MDDNTAFPWPQKGDQLFVAGDDWHNNAILNWTPDQWGLYSEGYKRAADILVDYIINRYTDQDTLVYPIVYLYRQHLELVLKQLLHEADHFLGNKADLPTGHKIDGLWTQCRPLLIQIDSRIPTEDLDAVAETIQQFCAVDPGSTAFRYPIAVGKVPAPSLPGLTQINLRNIAEVINRVSVFLEAARTEIYEWKSQGP